MLFVDQLQWRVLFLSVLRTFTQSLFVFSVYETSVRGFRRTEAVVVLIHCVQKCSGVWYRDIVTVSMDVWLSVWPEVVLGRWQLPIISLNVLTGRGCTPRRPPTPPFSLPSIKCYPSSTIAPPPPASGIKIDDAQSLQLWQTVAFRVDLGMNILLLRFANCDARTLVALNGPEYFSFCPDFKGT